MERAGITQFSAILHGPVPEGHSCEGNGHLSTTPELSASLVDNKCKPNLIVHESILK